MKLHVSWIAAALAGFVLAGCQHAPRKNSAATHTACAILHPIPQPYQLYLGADPDARVEQLPTPAGTDVMTRLDLRIIADPCDVDSLIQRGYEYAQRNERARSEADFARALALAPERTRIRWSQGWARFSVGDSACAIEAWQRAAELPGDSDRVQVPDQRGNIRASVRGDAFWVPYTLAIGYWTAGEPEVALDYYSAAVRSFSDRFACMDALNAYTRNWKPRERTAILDLAHAWIADGKRNRLTGGVHCRWSTAPAWIPPR
ncbi:MAG: hypothetical protein ABIS07_17835 [Dokdonella sp.]